MSNSSKARHKAKGKEKAEGLGAVWDHSTGKGRNRVRLGGGKEGGIIVGGICLSSSLFNDNNHEIRMVIKNRNRQTNILIYNIVIEYILNIY